LDAGVGAAARCSLGTAGGMREAKRLRARDGVASNSSSFPAWFSVKKEKEKCNNRQKSICCLAAWISVDGGFT
jgi:hypothetical protein